MADWSSLPSELVRTIGDKLEAIEDYSALSAVCRSFKFAAGKDQWRPDKVSQPPWLLLCCQDDDGSGKNNNNPPKNQRFLLSTYKDKKRFSLNLPEIRGRRCFGTPYGWLITLNHDGQLHLFNPLNRRRIALPEAPCHHRFHDDDDENYKKNWIRRRLRDRAILIKMPPNSYGSYGAYDDFLVATLTSDGSVSLMRPRTSSWEELYCSGKLIQCMFDVICYQGRMYAVGVAGRLIVCSNFDGPDPPTTEVFVAPNRELINQTSKLYLVESNGELLLIVRHRHYDDDDSYDDDDDPEADPHYNTDWFEVYKLDQKSKTWIELKDLAIVKRWYFLQHRVPTVKVIASTSLMTIMNNSSPIEVGSTWVYMISMMRRSSLSMMVLIRGHITQSRLGSFLHSLKKLSSYFVLYEDLSSHKFAYNFRIE